MKTAFFDIDTQIDFLFPAGALYVPGAERLLPAIVQLNRHAASRGLPLVSDVDAHTENDPEFKVWPPHCVAGTAGQAKPAATLLENRVVIPNRPVDIRVEGAAQIVFEKQKLDLFTNPNISALLEALGADEYVVYGVVTEYCVRCAALGLLATGKPVTLVTDAIQTLKQEDAERTFGEFRGLGGRLATVAEIIGRK
ncbi:MAG TPA: cysteine hydrolase family protein [Bryobacteraceae bacterium]|nr:cysteine hydrolase family protein [Bryobacteraceae bacterium]